MKFVNFSRIAIVILALGVAWIGFRLATHRHTGVLRVLAYARHSWQSSSGYLPNQVLSRSAPPGLPHSVRLTWKPSTSEVAGYNVYRRSVSNFTRINAAPVLDTSFVDTSVQPRQTYYYVTKAVAKNGAESRPSNEVQVVIPTP